jgi:type I site-specific restriction-modification system R (restriction) subunit
MPRSEVRYDLPSDASTSLVCSRRIDHGNGFVWHTAASGKTLTSFKASTLATLLPKLLNGEIETETACI